ncbi:MAG: hypothetical protein DMF61_05580 [Blastocatellia bacterium AA13]|nr:MAG: hypothetical protein DMF61_05580 [Blastocatellia bacterium AA13]
MRSPAKASWRELAADQYREVDVITSAGLVKVFEMLEPDEGQLSRRVLRGLGLQQYRPAT